MKAWIPIAIIAAYLAIALPLSIANSSHLNQKCTPACLEAGEEYTILVESGSSAIQNTCQCMSETTKEYLFINLNTGEKAFPGERQGD